MASNIGASSALFLVLLASFSSFSLAAKIIVGDSNHWQFGFNYTDWALKKAPFYQYDSLGCDLKGAKLVGNVVQGGGPGGFEFVLKKRKPHYFACGEHGGVHCSLGLMKFPVFPIRSYCHGN